MSVSALTKPKFFSQLPFLLLILVTLGYLYVTFTPLIQCPSCYLFSDGGDGLKNYYTSAYYVHHDKGLWFHGMNYPYGEHPVYTDNQPAWSLLMKLINTVFPMGMHVVGTINLLLLISLFVAVLALYGLLREFQLPRWYAALICLPVVFLSPQMVRFNGHYSLAYVCYLPLFLLLIVRWQKNGYRWKHLFWILLAVVWMGFTHLYFFFIACAFLIAWLFVLWIKNRFRWRKDFGRIALLVVLAGIAVYLPVKLTDPVTDRVKEAYGIYVFSATPAGTFLPWYGDWPKTWTEKYQIKQPDFESKSYLGIAGLLLSPFILFFAIRNLVVRRKREQSLSAGDSSPGVIAWAGFLVWIMATGWFYMAGGSLLLETFPVLGQFRSLGRLAWISYFTYLCFAAWFVYQVLQSLHKRWLKYLLAVLVSAVWVTWMWEAHRYTFFMTHEIYRRNDILRGDKPFLDVLHQHQLEPDDFQAILQVPLLIIGTENLPVHRGHWEFNNTIQCSWETGLPIVDFNMSRTSVSHALSLLQLISTPDILKKRLDAMNEKPLLLTTHVAQLLPTEQRLISLADSLGMVGHMKLYRLDISDFAIPMEEDSVHIVAQEGFEAFPSDHALEGSGSFSPEKNAVFYSHPDTTGMWHEFSCWTYLDRDISGFPAIVVNQYGPDGAMLEEQVHSIHSFNPWQVRDNWVEIRCPLQPKMKHVRFDFSTLNKGAIFDVISIRRPAQ